MNTTQLIHQYIVEHLISMPELARRLDVSRQRLYYFFKSYKGESTMVDKILDVLGLEAEIILKPKATKSSKPNSK